ncbi:PREDICTED: protein FAM98A [Cyphomyrmex costatus]|uniref:Protein FAM98A n=1 Tax=Cyphomyrmex costatus TaxID=456900 RepID=A0A151IDL6_9HYME|nr:PREDICTED: protein FAM98A [Cyphomyrmex costatus]KYM98540.1 Protein FAM98A [Cyphomyrmex costatus]
MEDKLLQMFQDVGYTGPMLDTNKLSNALKLGAKSPDFTSLINWFSEQLATFIDIDETVNATASSDDASSFLLELSFFLKEIGCMNEKLITGHMNQRLANESERAILIEFLAAELMACKLLEVKCPKETNQIEVTIDESDTARTLKNMLVTLKFQKPPDNISSELLFSRLETKLLEILKTVPPNYLDKPLIDVELSAKQWEKLGKLQEEMHKEYIIRRELLLKRLDVTVQSFLWSDRIKSRETEINNKYEERRKTLKNEPRVTLADLLAARDDLAIIEKTSNASVRKNTRSKINSVLIGMVPDRGGRPYEQEPPPPEMPPWQKDRVQGPQSFQVGRGAGGGGRGGGRGSRGGSGGGGSGYRDHKDASSNFGQNLDYQQQSQYSGHGHRECYPDHRDTGGYQRGSSGGGGGGSYRGDFGMNYNQNYSQNYNQNYQQPQYSGQRDSYGDNNQGGGFYYHDREGRGGRGGRVQGGWNSYQRGGYNRGREQY